MTGRDTLASKGFPLPKAPAYTLVYIFITTIIGQKIHQLTLLPHNVRNLWVLRDNIPA